MDISTIKSTIDQAKGAKNSIEASITILNKDLSVQAVRKISIENGQALIQLAAKETQEKLRYHVQDIVNTAMDTCFPDEDYTFTMDFEIKRGRTEANLYLKDNSDNKTDPMTASGGGLVDIISFALRLSAWTLSKKDAVIILDEPFKFLSANLRPLAGEILKTLSKQLNLQVIMVTHDEVMIDISDKVFKVKQKYGKSRVE